MPTLVARSGPLAGRRFELEDEVVLGREGATITLVDEETSRRHAAIRIVAGTAVIEDLGSTNGTFVDGRRIAAATELRGGETIKLGQSIFYIETEEAPEPVADAGATRLAKRPEPIGDPDRTRLRVRAPEPAADPDLTPPPPAPGPVPAAAAPPSSTPVPAAAAADQPFGTFSPPVPRRRRGVASRKLGPSLVSFVTIITTAAALVVYFAGR